MDKEFIEYVAETLGVSDLGSVTEKATLDMLGADSLDKVELIMGVEDRYKITIPDDEAEKFKNLGDLYNYVQRNKK